MIQLKYTELNKIHINDYAVILTDLNSQGWRLKRGTIVTLDLQGNKFGSDNKYVRPGFILNDKFFFSTLQNPEETIFQFTVSEPGTYYLCLISDEFPLCYV